MRLECGCGYVARGASEMDFVVAARAHAWDAHRIDLTAEQLLGVAREKHAGENQPASPAGSVDRI